MVDRVVYLFGAGFSAPMGLPLMNDFLVKSKDMFAESPDRYSHFSGVFDAINRMSVIKNYLNTDLSNIEEILSILEIDSFLGGKRLEDKFRRYLCDVIEYYTPPIEGSRSLPSNWHRFAFGKSTPWTGHGYFLLNLFNLKLNTGSGRSRTGLMAQRETSPKARYAIVTLNYDRIPEMVSGFINQGEAEPTPHQFARSISEVEGDPDATPLAKLHGSSEECDIVPPTWSKGTHPEIAPVWDLASHVLRNANHIRIIGYSLPTADAYVRYLLKSAVIETTHLKRIDVIGWDPAGGARRRFDDFVTYPRYRYAEARTEDYLRKLLAAMFPDPIAGGGGRWHDKLEEVHEAFMQSPAGDASTASI